MRFERTPEKIDAYQWDGTVDGAGAVGSFVYDYPETEVTSVTLTVRFDEELHRDGYVEIRFARYHEVRLYEEHWIVFDENGTPSALDSKSLDQHYRAVRE